MKVPEIIRRGQYPQISTLRWLQTQEPAYRIPGFVEAAKIDQNARNHTRRGVKKGIPEESKREPGMGTQAYFQQRKPIEKSMSSGKSHRKIGSRFHSTECLTNLSALRWLQPQCARPKMREVKICEIGKAYRGIQDAQVFSESKKPPFPYHLISTTINAAAPI